MAVIGSTMRELATRKLGTLVCGMLMAVTAGPVWSAEPGPASGLQIQLTYLPLPSVRLTITNAAGTRQALLYTEAVETSTWSLLTSIDVASDPVFIDDVATNAARYYTVKRAPVFAASSDSGTNTVDELILFTITNSVSGFEPGSVFYELAVKPDGAQIDPVTGLITWQTTEKDGPGTNLFKTIVRTGGVYPLTDTNVFAVVVREVNSPPEFLTRPPNQTIDELKRLVYTNAAWDADIPANTLTYRLAEAPNGAQIDPTSGVIQWTPSEAQGPGRYTLTTIVSDHGNPEMTETNSFEVMVQEVNAAPRFRSRPTDRVVEVHATPVVEVLDDVVVSNAATDSDDIPPNQLTYRLVNPPANSSIDAATGVITWHPKKSQWPGSYVFTTEATDNGVPPLKATNSFTVTMTNKSMVRIPGGTFRMGDMLDNTARSLPVHEVEVGEFYIEQQEVSGALWSEVYQWAIANGYKFDTAATFKGPTYPAANLTWYGAVRWCNARSEMEGRRPAYYTDEARTQVYRGKDKIDIKNEWVDWSSGGYRLPTEAEWERAARIDQGTNGWRFPWGNTISHAEANYTASPLEFVYDVNRDAGPNPVGGKNNPRTSLVSYFRQTPSLYATTGLALYNMAGNVEEWCWDWSGTYPAERQVDPRGPNQGTYRVRRGGSWTLLADYARVHARSLYRPTAYNSGVGFRCVVSPGR